MTPGFRRATIEIVLPHWSVSSLIGNARRKSTGTEGKKIEEKSNDRGSTPTTSRGVSPIRTLVPTIPGSPAKRLIQNPCVRMIASGPPQVPSSGVKFRPTTGSMPSTSRKLSETSAAISCSAGPSVMSAYVD